MGDAAPLPYASSGIATGDAGADSCDGVVDLEKRETLSCADREAWLSRVRWSTDCEAANQATVRSQTAGLEFFALGSGRKLLKVLCAPGAYQGYANYFLLDGADGGVGRLAWIGRIADRQPERART